MKRHADGGEFLPLPSHCSVSSPLHLLVAGKEGDKEP